MSGHLHSFFPRVSCHLFSHFAHPCFSSESFLRCLLLFSCLFHLFFMFFFFLSDTKATFSERRKLSGKVDTSYSGKWKAKGWVELPGHLLVFFLLLCFVFLSYFFGAFFLFLILDKKSLFWESKKFKEERKEWWMQAPCKWNFQCGGQKAQRRNRTWIKCIINKFKAEEKEDKYQCKKESKIYKLS